MIRPGVVDRDEPPHAHDAGRALDLDDRRVRAARRRPARTRSGPSPARRRAGRRRRPRPPSRPSPSSGSRTSRRRPPARRCRRCAPSRAPDRRRAGRRRSARTASRGPARPASSRRCTTNAVAVARDLRVLEQPAGALDARARRRCRRARRAAPPAPRPTRRPRVPAARSRPAPCAREPAPGDGRPGDQLAARGPGSARSRPSRTSSRARSGTGTTRTRLRRRSSTGSIPSSRAAASSVVSIR